MGHNLAEAEEKNRKILSAHQEAVKEIKNKDTTSRNMKHCAKNNLNYIVLSKV